MNRREFLRSLVAASVFGATGIVGITELVAIARNRPQQPSSNLIVVSETTSPNSTTPETATSSIVSSQTSSIATSETTSSVAPETTSTVDVETSSIVTPETSSTTISSETTEQQQITSTASSSSGDSSSPSGYFLLTALSAIEGRSYVYFRHPTYGNSILVNYNGSWYAFSSTCTHEPCTVDFRTTVIYCPCHGGEFNPSDGSVILGPPPRPLPEYNVLIQNGNVYVSD